MTETVRRGSRRLTFFVLAAGAGFFAMLQSLITPVLPTIQHDLHTSQNTVTWVLTAYLLSASIFTPILGRVGDMVGKERMLVVSSPRSRSAACWPPSRPASACSSSPGSSRASAAPSSRSRSGSSATSSPPRG